MTTLLDLPMYALLVGSAAIALMTCTMMLLPRAPTSDPTDR